MAPSVLYWHPVHTAYFVIPRAKSNLCFGPHKLSIQGLMVHCSYCTVRDMFSHNWHDTSLVRQADGVKEVADYVAKLRRVGKGVCFLPLGRLLDLMSAWTGFRWQLW